MIASPGLMFQKTVPVANILVNFKIRKDSALFPTFISLLQRLRSSIIDAKGSALTGDTSIFARYSRAIEIFYANKINDNIHISYYSDLLIFNCSHEKV